MAAGIFVLEKFVMASWRRSGLLVREWSKSVISKVFCFILWYNMSHML
jgi:hypothetical protein